MAAAADLPSKEGPLAIICGGGSLPFAVAEAAAGRGRGVVLFALREWADPQRVAAYRHHWITIGQFGRFSRMARQEGCRDVVCIGSVVRPALWQVFRVWPDLTTIRLLPRAIRMFRGGDGHLLSTLARVFEEHGFRLVGAQEFAPEILMPEGALGTRQPSEAARRDIAQGLALLNATGPFDIGQAVVVTDRHILAIEAAEGTDRMLARVAEMRQNGRIRSAGGVLVKAPKPGQDRRIDLPTIGPRTIEGAARAGLEGVAVLAGSSIVAEPELIADRADRERLFVLGVRDEALGR
jgi:UDP-2,3-diacylglucosamine hydrolase